MPIFTGCVYFHDTVSEYVAELRRLATTCEFGTFLNEALCDRLVCGLKEEAMQRRLLAEPSLDLLKSMELQSRWNWIQELQSA